MQFFVYVIIFLISSAAWANPKAALNLHGSHYYSQKQIQEALTITWEWLAPNLNIESIHFDVSETQDQDAFTDGKSIILKPNLTNVQLKLAIVHELVHIIRYYYSPGEELWVNEGLAKLSEVLFAQYWSYTLEMQLKENNEFAVLSNASDYSHYGKGYVSSFFLMNYLYNQLGEMAFFKELLVSQETGWNAILEVANKMMKNKTVVLPIENLTSERIFINFVTSLYFNSAYSAPYALYYFDNRFTNLNQSMVFRAPWMSQNSCLRLNLKYKTRSTCFGKKMKYDVDVLISN